jgi:hypothetical protein
MEPRDVGRDPVSDVENRNAGERSLVDVTEPGLEAREAVRPGRGPRGSIGPPASLQVEELVGR